MMTRIQVSDYENTRQTVQVIQHKKYPYARSVINLWRDAIPEGFTLGSVQMMSDLFVEEHNNNMVDHYNPRHLPTILGPVFITSTHVILECADSNADDDVPTARTWWRR